MSASLPADSALRDALLDHLDRGVTTSTALESSLRTAIRAARARDATASRWLHELPAAGTLIGLEEQRQNLRTVLTGVMERGETNSVLLVGHRCVSESVAPNPVLMVRLGVEKCRRAIILYIRSGCGKSFTLEKVLGDMRDGAASDPFAIVHLDGSALPDDGASVKEISRQLALDPEAALAAAAAAEEEDEEPAATPRRSPSGDFGSSSSSDDSSVDDDDGEAVPKLAPPRKRPRRRTGERNAVHGSARARTARLEDHLDFVVSALRDGRAGGVPVVLVIDEFDVFAQRTRQTLLYNLLDLTQSAHVQFAMVGLSARLDVLELLEKRLRSRFSHRQLLFLHPPKVAMAQIVLAALILSPGSHGHLDEADRVAHNRAMIDMLQEAPVLAMLDHVHHIGRSPRWVHQWLSVAAHCISESSPALDAGMLQRAWTILTEDTRLTLLAGVSQLEASLLIAVGHLEERKQEPHNFEQVYNEYKSFAQSVSSSFRPFDKEVALKAWEHLVEMDLLKWTMVSRDTTSAMRANVLTGKQFQLARLMIEPSDILEAIKAGRLSVPTEMRRWAQEGLVS